MPAHHAADLQRDPFRLPAYSVRMGRLLPVRPSDLAVVFRTFQLAKIQPQSVGHHAEARKAHCRRAVHRVQRYARPDERARRKRNADDVIDERPEQIFVNIPQSRAAQADCRGNVRETALHQHHIRRVNRDICPRADRNARIRSRQRGRVVDAVSDHRNMTLPTQIADDLLLAVRQNTCHHFFDARATRNRPCGAFVVARQHHHAHAHSAQFLHRTRAVLLDGIGNRDDAEQLSVPQKQQGRFAVVGERADRFLHSVCQFCLSADEFRAPADEFRAVLFPAHTVAGKRFETVRRFGCQTSCFRFAHHRARQRMLALFLKRQRRRKQVTLADSLCGQDVGHARNACRDSSRFVQRHNLRAPCGFQRRGGFEENSVPRANAVSDHDCNRGRKAERARTADDQHRNRPRQCVTEVPSHRKPDDQHHERDRHDSRHEHARHAIRDLCDRGFRCRRVADHADDLRQRGVLSDPRCLTPQKARPVDGCRRHAVARMLVHRDAFARQRRLVNRALPVQNHAVHGNILPRADDEHIAFLHLPDRNGHFRAVPHDHGGFGGKLHQRPQGVGGFSLRPRLKHFPNGNQGQDHRRRLEIKLVHVDHHRRHVPSRLRAGHGKQRVNAPDKRRARTERHEGVHIGRAMPKRAEAALEKAAVDHHDRNAEK